MKRAFWLAIVLCGAFVCITSGTLTAHAAQIKLTYSTFLPPSHVQAQLVAAWCREVESRTNGRVKVEFHPGGTLTKAAECYEGVVKGRSDIGFSVLSYTADRFPVMSTVDLPLGYTSGKVATGVANEVYRRFKPKELSDTKVMYLHAHGPGLIHTKGKIVRKMEDMRGLKFRTTGTSEMVVKALGGIAIPKPMPECYQMLQKGEVIGSVHPLEANQGWKLAEVVDYVTTSFPVAYTSVFFVVMNKNRWESLPKDIQTIIEEVNNEWVVQHGEAWDTSDTEGMRFFLAHGKQIIGLESKEGARWKKAVAPIIDNYANKLNKQGFNGQEIVDFTIETLNSMQ